MSINPHTRLVEAIVGIDDVRLRRLYLDSPEFHAAVDLVAKVLPLVIGLLADDAARTSNEREQMIQALRHSPSPPILPC